MICQDYCHIIYGSIIIGKIYILVDIIISIMKDLDSRFIPKAMLKMQGHFSAPAISLLYNLCFFERESEYKDFKSLKETNKKLKGSFLEFTGNPTNFRIYLKELIDSKLVEFEDEDFKDKRKRAHTRKVYRVIPNKSVFIRIYDIFQTLNYLGLNGAENVDFVKELERTDYYLKDPILTWKGVMYWYGFQIKQLKKKLGDYEEKAIELGNSIKKRVPNKDYTEEILALLDEKKSKNKRRKSKK